MNLDDLRLFAVVAEEKSFTGASRALGVPKQTLSRRIADLEATLGVQLLHRTTRTLHLTEAGTAYAERCREIVRLGEDAKRAMTEARSVTAGPLRVTADPLFGETFLRDVLIEYATAHPGVELEVVLTQRRVDLIEEGIDVAVRVGHVEHAALTGTKLGPARIRYCASPSYIAKKGQPRSPEELSAHDCVVMPVDGSAPRWPLSGKRGPTLIPVKGRLSVNSFAVAYAAARAGVGIAMMPEFFCHDDLVEGSLVSVLDDCLPDGGHVWLVHPTHRYLVARVRAFVDLVVARLGKSPPWVVSAKRTARKAAAAPPELRAAAGRARRVR